jgi:hypothetical protein
MTIRAEPMTGNKITVDANGRVTFYLWKVKHDQPLERWDQMGFAVLDYLRERLETEAAHNHERRQHHERG